MPLRAQDKHVSKACVCGPLLWVRNTLSDARLNTQADANFTFGSLIRSNHHFLYGFVSNTEQSLVKFDCVTTNSQMENEQAADLYVCYPGLL